MSVASVARSASPVGLGAGLVFWIASLTPTLVPRGWIVQGVTSGACLAIGYGIGTMAERAARRAIHRPRGGPELRRHGPVASLALVLVVSIGGFLAWATWQDEARDLVGMAHLAWWEGPPMAFLSLVVGTVLIRISATLGTWICAAHNRIRGRLPGRLGLPATIVLAVTLVGLVGGQVVLRGFVVAANVIYEGLDQGTNPGIDQPTLETVSEAPDRSSHGKRWDSGVATSRRASPRTSSSSNITGPMPTFAIRSGSSSACGRPGPSTSGRPSRCASWSAPAASTGASSRYGCPVGRAGWTRTRLGRSSLSMPATPRSSPPSTRTACFFSLVIDSSQAIQAGAALFDAVHERWSALPDQDRPRLIVFGASLGAGGAERPFVGSDADASVANFASRASGALIVGSLGWNPIFRQLTAEREPGSPAWEPIYASGEAVRFLTGRSRPDPDTGWGPSRVLYLQHPSDPVAYLSLDYLWSPLEWMDDPPRPGRPARHRLVPDRLGRPGGRRPVLPRKPAVRLRARLPG